MYDCLDSFTFVQPIVDHAPDAKTMARQWYQGYRYGPYWVPPLVMPGTLSNVLLAYLAATPQERNLYIAAALGVFSIMPMTFFYMEPGINGATKWKVQSLLKEEGMRLPDTSIFKPSTHRQSATKSSRRWAEKTDMKELILKWRDVNNYRWIIVGVAAVLSGYATFSQPL